VSLLAMAVGQATLMVEVPALSLAGQLPQLLSGRSIPVGASLLAMAVG